MGELKKCCISSSVSRGITRLGSVGDDGELRDDPEFLSNFSNSLVVRGELRVDPEFLSNFSNSLVVSGEFRVDPEFFIDFFKSAEGIFRGGDLRRLFMLGILFFLELMYITYILFIYLSIARKVRSEFYGYKFVDA